MLRDLKRALLAVGMMLALSSFALGHDENSQGAGSQRAYSQGYSDGFQHGREDRSRRLGYDYQSDDYRRAERGYDNNSGDRNQFTTAYRAGYQEGYDDGYNGRGQSAGGYDRWRGHDDHNHQGGYGSHSVAYENGYRDGVDGARKDISQNKRFDYNDHGWYRDAVHGYSSRYGNKEAYRQQYRQGYEAGYREVFDQRSPGYRNGNRGNSNVAYDNGYRDGIDGARSDISENRRFDYNDHGWYRDADHGYSSGYGNKETYRQQYRLGYEAGYRATFNQRSPGSGNGRWDADAAYANGYSDGIVGARKDLADRKSADPTRHDWYNEANRGYDGRYGTPQNYKQRYREGYVAGYNDTFRGRR